MPKTNKQEAELEKRVDRTTERPNLSGETTLVEVASNAGSETTSIVELNDEDVTEHKRRMSVKISNSRTTGQADAHNSEPEPAATTTVTWLKQPPPVTFLGPKDDTTNEELRDSENSERKEARKAHTQEATTSRGIK